MSEYVSSRFELIGIVTNVNVKLENEGITDDLLLFEELCNALNAVTVWYFKNKLLGIIRIRCKGLRLKRTLSKSSPSCY